MAIGDYHYLALEAKWDGVAHRHLTLRNVGLGGVVLLGTWLLWSALFAHNPHGPLPPPHGFPGTPGHVDAGTPDLWVERADRVRQAYLHAYHGWETYASPADELLPLTNKSVNNFNGWGVTMFDSLDTMLLMGLKDEFNRALQLVEKTEFRMLPTNKAPFFETVIRYLGGLLAAYALSGEQILLQKADELGTAMSPAFETNSGFPNYGVNTVTGETTHYGSGGLAEIASCQIEYMYLAKATGKAEYFDRADKVMKSMEDANLVMFGGMLPTSFKLDSGQPADTRLTVGAAGDSAHEYLLKQYLQTAKTDKKSLEMYLRMTTEVIATLLYLSPERGMLYVTDTNRFMPSQKFEHLSCFFPGLLALGAHTLPLDSLDALGVSFAGLAAGLPDALRATYATLARYPLRELHLWAAEGLAQSCWLTYADTRSGLAPDVVKMRVAKGGKGNVRWLDALESWKEAGARGAPPGTGRIRPLGQDRERRKDYEVLKASYLLRPETVESFYIMWRATKDGVWRERGWAVFEALERTSRTKSGYAAVMDTDETPVRLYDSQQSFFLAETLKHLFLLFTEEDLVPLDRWVFNTEAHPLPVFEWTPGEKAYFGIP